MGEARRRKTLDSSWGKPTPIIFQKPTADEVKRFETESLALIDVRTQKPDFGLQSLKMFGVVPIHTCLDPSCMTICGLSRSPINKEIYFDIGFNLSGALASIYLTKKTYKEWIQNESGVLKIIPCVQDRYLNPSGSEWVIPMYEFREGIDSISENNKSDLPIQSLQGNNNIGGNN